MACAICLLVGHFPLDLVQAQDQQMQPTVTDSKAATSAPAASASDADSGHKITAGARYLPKGSELSKEDETVIRAAVVNEAVEYHKSYMLQNRAAGAKHDLLLADLQNHYDSSKWHREHTHQVLATHATLSVVIFWVVIAIVAISLWLTIHQFTKDSANADAIVRKILHELRDEDVPVGALEVQQQSSSQQTASGGIRASMLTTLLNIIRGQQTLSLNTSGVQLGTQLVGLVILVFAMAFFYLYLDRVYPVTLLEPAKAADAQSSK